MADEVKFVFANEKASNYVLDTIFRKLEQINSKIPIFLVPDWNNKGEIPGGDFGTFKRVSC